MPWQSSMQRGSMYATHSSTAANSSTETNQRPKLCNDAGICERDSSSSGRGSGKSPGDAVKSVIKAKQMESLAFNGGMGMETENANGFSFDLDAVKSMGISHVISVATVWVFVLVAILMWIGRSCFWK